MHTSSTLIPLLFKSPTFKSRHLPPADAGLNLENKG